MSSTKNRINILLSTYQGERYIQESIASILGQSLQDFELLIIDDASSDKTLKIIENFKDDRISIEKNKKRKGLFPNLNALILRSNAPLIKLWGQDDIMSVNCLAAAWDFYQEYSSLGCFWCANYTINGHGNIIGEPDPDLGTPIVLSQEKADVFSLMYGCLSANISNLFIPRSVFEKVGYFNEYSIAADFDMMVRIQEHYPVGHTHEPLLYLRCHPAQWSQQLNGIKDYVETSVALHQILFQRVVFQHKAMSESEAHKILRKKSAGNFFDNIVKLAMAGYWRDAIATAKVLHHLEPLPILAAIWTGQIGSKIKRRLRWIKNNPS